MSTLMASRETAWVTDVVAAYRAGRPLALLFDYDGTLTPIVRHPSLARLPAANRDRLIRLAALPDVIVGVFSGRALAEVRAFVGIDGLYYAGSGGLELALGGPPVEFPGAAAFRLAAAAVEADLAPVLGRFPGTWVERKPVALAVHYRGLGPVAAVRFRAEASAVLNRHPGTQHREVSEALEVTPAGGWDKGTAVELVLERVGPEVFPVYFGDAANDAEAMAVAGFAGGVAVGVGPDAPPTATHRVASPAEVEVWLDRLVRDLPPARGLQPTTSPVYSVGREGMITDSAPAVVGAAPGPDEGPAPAVGPPTGPGMLIVEPDPHARAGTAAAFRRHGWRAWAASPDDAVRALRANAGDIQAAVVDLQLPGLLGMRVLSDLLRVRPDLVRCGMSADVSPYAAAAFRRLSDVTLFPKPLDIESVSGTLRWLVGADDRPYPPAEGT